MTRFGRGALATILNAIVLAPAVLMSDADTPILVSFIVLASAFAWFEARGGEALDLADEGYPWAALAAALTTLALFWLAALTPGEVSSTPASVIGGVLMAAGITLRSAAMRALGRNFVSEVKAAPRLVSAGIYRRMRHPSELGLLALTLGAGLLFGSWVSVTAWLLVMLPLVLVRVRAEDRELRCGFGSAHVEYCGRVGWFW